MPYKPPVRPIFGTTPAAPKKKKNKAKGAGPAQDPFSIAGTVLTRPLTPIGDLAKLATPFRPATTRPHDLPVRPVVKPAPVVRSKPKPAPVPAKKPPAPVVPVTTEKPVRLVRSPAAPAVNVTATKPKKNKGKTKPTRAPAAASQPSVQAQVQQIVNSVLNPQLAILNTQATQQNKAIQEGAAALIRELKGLPPVDYKGGADQVAQLAALSSAGLANANPNQQDQTLLQAINAPQAQQDQLQNQLANVFGGGAATLFQTGGKMPAQSIIEQGLAGQTFDRSLPGINALQAQQSLRSALAGQAQQRQQVLGQVPKLRMDIESALAERGLKQQQLDIERQAFGLKIEDHRLKAQNQQFTQQATVQRLKNDSYRLNLSTLNSDRNYQLGLDRLDISEGSLRLRAAQLDAKLAADAKNGGFTTSQRIQFKKRAGKVADQAFNGVPVKEKGVVVGYNHLTYQQAIKQMLSQGIPLTVAQQALNVYWKSGEDKSWETNGEGRPVQSFTVRQALKKKRNGRR